MKRDNYGPIYYQDNLEFITAVTEMLNDTELPETLGGFYITVQLKDESGVTYGEWSDEIASDAWGFQTYITPVEPTE